jgi:flagellar protein FlaJ
MKKESVESKEIEVSFIERTIEGYLSFCYKTLGRYLDFKYDFIRLNAKLKQGDVNVTGGMYISTIAFSSILITFMGSILFSMLFFNLIQDSSWVAINIMMILLLFLLSLGTYPFIVQTRISKKSSEIDRELPYLLSELSILASTGLSPIQIVRKISKRKENKFVTNEFKKIVYKIDIEGKDIITALGEAAQETPSYYMTETLWDFSNMIHEGGNLERYLRDKAEEGLQMKKDMMKLLIEKISTFMELYISFVLMGVLFVAIGAFMVDATGSQVFGLDAEAILNILTYGFIPVMVAAFSLIVSASTSGVD